MSRCLSYQKMRCWIQTQSFERCTSIKNVIQTSNEISRHIGRSLSTSHVTTPCSFDVISWVKNSFSLQSEKMCKSPKERKENHTKIHTETCIYSWDIKIHLFRGCMVVRAKPWGTQKGVKNWNGMKSR